jgi:hypothetical protein
LYSGLTVVASAAANVGFVAVGFAYAMYALNEGVSVAPKDKKYAPKTPKNTAGKVFPRMNSMMHARMARRPPKEVRISILSQPMGKRRSYR